MDASSLGTSRNGVLLTPANIKSPAVGEFSLTPGPGPVPMHVVAANLHAQTSTRGARIGPYLRDVRKRVGNVLGVGDGKVIILSSTGTGAFESGLVTTTPVGSKVLATNIGTFSNAFVKCASDNGYDVQVLAADPGQAMPYDQYYAALSRDTGHEIRLVHAIHNETSTGVTSDVPRIRQILNELNHPALLLVDGISSVGSIACPMQDWGIDLLAACSQKGFMSPTGGGILGISQKAIQAARKITSRAHYLNFLTMHDENEKTGAHPLTAPMAVYRTLDAALQLMETESMERVYQRHYENGAAVRAAVQAWGLKLVATSPQLYSNTVTAVWAPEGMEANKLVLTAFHRYDVELAGVPGALANKAFRIAHTGGVAARDVLTAVTAMSNTLIDHGYPREKAQAGILACMETVRGFSVDRFNHPKFDYG